MKISGAKYTEIWSLTVDGERLRRVQCGQTKTYFYYDSAVWIKTRKKSVAKKIEDAIFKIEVIDRGEPY